jgi:hypothetical protein
VNYHLSSLLAGLFTTDFINRQRYDSMKGDGEALLEKLIASIKTTKARSKISS